MRRSTSWTVFVPVAWAGLCLASPWASRADNWPGWRGPTGVGRSAEKSLPLQWDGKSGENVLWKASLAGTTGHSSPIVWGDRVFLTTAAKQTGEQEERKEVPEPHLVCYQAADGKTLWRTPIPSGKQPAGYAIYAVPTPVTDGKVVYAWFGSAVMAAVDSGGKLLWRKERPGPFKLNPGICSSPILHKDTVILLCDQGRGEGFLQGLAKRTGEVKWQQKREKVSYNNTTPLLIEVKGKPQMVIAGKYVYKARRDEDIVCLDLATGRELYTAKLDGISKLASPFATADGRVYFATAGKSYVIQAGPSLKVLAANDLGGEMDGSSPAVSGGRAFIRGRKFLYCVGRR